MLKKIEVPSEINEISLKQFQAWLENPDDIKRKLSIFLNQDLIDIETIEDEFIADLNNDIDLLLSSEHPYSLRVLIDGNPYQFVPDINKVSFGEYIDISTYLPRVEQWHRLMAIVFKPVEKNAPKLSYEGTDDIKDVFLDMPLGEVTASINLLSLFIKDVHSKYPEIYDNGTSEGIEAINYFSKWGWYATIKALSNDNVLNVDNVTKMNVHEIHNYLAADIDEKKFKHQLQVRGTDKENTIYL